MSMTTTDKASGTDGDDENDGDEIKWYAYFLFKYNITSLDHFQTYQRWFSGKCCSNCHNHCFWWGYIFRSDKILMSLLLHATTLGPNHDRICLRKKSSYWHSTHPSVREIDTTMQMRLRFSESDRRKNPLSLRIWICEQIPRKKIFIISSLLLFPYMILSSQILHKVIEFYEFFEGFDKEEKERKFGLNAVLTYQLRDKQCRKMYCT